MAEFEVTQGEGRLEEYESPDFVRAFDNAIALARNNMQLYERSEDARTRQRIEDEQYQLGRLSELAEYSDTLLTQLVDFQEKRNKYQEGLGFAQKMREGLSEDQRVNLQQQEDELASGQQVANQTANEYRSKGGTETNASAIRNTGGWAGYGRYKASLTLLGQEFPSVLQQAKSSGFTVEYNGKILTAQSAETDDEYKAWQDGVVAAFTSQLAGANDDVVTQYVLEPMRKSAGIDFANWSEERGKAIAAEQKQGRARNLLVNLQTKGGAETLLEWYKTHPGSLRDARLELNSVLVEMRKAGVITTDEALGILESPYTFGTEQSSFARKFPLEFAATKRLLQNAEVDDVNARTRLNQAKVDDIVARLNDQYVATGQRPTDAQMQEIIRTLPPGTNYQKLLNMTVEARDREEDTARLNQILSSGRRITKSDLEGVDPRVADKFKKYVEDDNKWMTEAEAAGFGDFGRAANEIARTKLGLEGDQVGGSKLVVAQSKIQGFLRTEYLTLRQTNPNMTAEQAAQQAAINVGVRVNGVKGTGGADGMSEKELYGVNFTPLNTKSKQMLEDASLQIRDFPETLTKNLFPGSEEQLQKAVAFLQTGKGSMPSYYTSLAYGTQFTAEQLVRQQAQAANIEITSPEPPTPPLDPLFLDQLTRRPSAANTNMVYMMTSNNSGGTGGSNTTGDAGWLLDVIASKESTAYGGYDAYNRGGSNNGHTAHGSGNSADPRYGWEKPLTKMTVGEVMAMQDRGVLHATGRYQIIRSTLRGLVQRYGIDPNALYDPQMQDRLALLLMRQRVNAGNSYIGLQNEWIGLQNLPAEEMERFNATAISIFNQPQNLLPGLKPDG